MKSCIKHLVIIALILVGFACKKDNSVVPVPDPEPTEFRHAFYPLAVGNTWLYTDTTETFAGPVYGTDTLKITSWRRDSLGVWWKFRWIKLGVENTYELMERNDSVFTLQFPFRVQHSAFAALEYLYPASGDTTFFTAFVGGDATITKAAVINLLPYRTPAGNFKGSVEFSSGQLNTVQVFYRGLGFIGSDEFYIPATASVPVGSSVRLKSYTLIP